MWKIEIYNSDTRRWTQYGRATADFSTAYKKVGSLQEAGNRARLVKLEQAAAEQEETK